MKSIRHVIVSNYWNNGLSLLHRQRNMLFGGKNTRNVKCYILMTHFCALLNRDGWWFFQIKFTSFFVYIWTLDYIIWISEIDRNLWKIIKNSPLPLKNMPKTAFVTFYWRCSGHNNTRKVGYNKQIFYFVINFIVWTPVKHMQNLRKFIS